MFTKLWWKDTVERSLSTGAQTFLTTLGLSNTGPANLFDMDWQVGVGSFLAGVLLTVMKSMAAAKLVDHTISPASLAEQ